MIELKLEHDCCFEMLNVSLKMKIVILKKIIWLSTNVPLNQFHEVIAQND